MDKKVAVQLIEQNLEVYNKIAKHFSDTRQYVWDDLKRFSAFVKEGDVVLDLGCGSGRLYQIFDGLPISYIGIDQSEELLVLARKQFQKGKFLAGNMLSIPLPDQSVDIIYCIAAFQHIPSRELQSESLFEMKRVLKPGGKIIMSNWNLFGSYGLRQVSSGKYKELGEGDFLVPWMDTGGKILGERYYHGFDLEELSQLCTEAGFEVTDQYFTKRNERVDQEKGENIITIASLK